MPMESCCIYFYHLFTCVETWIEISYTILYLKHRCSLFIRVYLESFVTLYGAI